MRQVSSGKGAIGIFDSGYGGLTVFRQIRDLMPQYDYIYLGDNARAPYGNRGFDTIHQFTWQAVQWLFGQGCPLVVLACNTASAKALRTIQQQDLPVSDDPSRRVLGVIRPTTEMLGTLTKTGKVGIMGTEGTVQSGSYVIELQKFWPQLQVFQQSCPMLVPLIETGMHSSAGADFFVRYYLDALFAQNNTIDTVLLACTHYPLLLPLLQSLGPAGMQYVAQGPIVANSLADYLLRHAEMKQRLTTRGDVQFFTTDSIVGFEQHAAIFYGQPVIAQQVFLG